MLAPAWMAATTYLAALTASALLGSCALLASQLRLLLHGQSYLESLLAPAAAAPVGLHVHTQCCIYCPNAHGFVRGLQCWAVEIAQANGKPREGQGCMDALRRVFGSEHPMHWLRMRWENPPGVGIAGPKKGM